MSRKGNCIDNGATEQLFGHVKDEFFRSQEFASFEEFKEGLEEYIIHWNTRRRQVKLRGLTRRSSGISPYARLSRFSLTLSKNWGAVQEVQAVSIWILL